MQTGTPSTTTLNPKIYYGYDYVYNTTQNLIYEKQSQNCVEQMATEGSYTNYVVNFFPHYSTPTCWPPLNYNTTTDVITSSSSSTGGFTSSSSISNPSSSFSSSVLLSSSFPSTSSFICDFNNNLSFSATDGTYAYTIPNTYTITASESTQSFLYYTINNNCSTNIAVTISSSTNGNSDLVGLLLTTQLPINITSYIGAWFDPGYAFYGYLGGSTGIPTTSLGSISVPWTINIQVSNYLVNVSIQGVSFTWYVPNVQSYLGMLVSSNGGTEVTTFTNVTATAVNETQYTSSYSIVTYGADIESEQDWVVKNSETSFSIGSSVTVSTSSVYPLTNGTFVYWRTTGDFSFSATLTSVQDYSGSTYATGCVFMTTVNNENITAAAYFDYTSYSGTYYYSYLLIGETLDSYNTVGNSPTGVQCNISISNGQMTLMTTVASTTVATSITNGYVGLFVNDGMAGSGNLGFQAAVFEDVTRVGYIS